MLFTILPTHTLKQSRPLQKSKLRTYSILIPHLCRRRFCYPQDKNGWFYTIPYHSYRALFLRDSSDYHNHTDTANSPSSPRHHEQCCRSCCQGQGRHMVLNLMTENNHPESSLLSLSLFFFIFLICFLPLPLIMFTVSASEML